MSSSKSGGKRWSGWEDGQWLLFCVRIRQDKRKTCLDSIESAINVFWDLACDFEVENVAFEARGLVHASKDGRRWESGGGAWSGDLAVGVVLGMAAHGGGKVEYVRHDCGDDSMLGKTNKRLVQA